MPCHQPCTLCIDTKCLSSSLSIPTANNKFLNQISVWHNLSKQYTASTSSSLYRQLNIDNPTAMARPSCTETKMTPKKAQMQTRKSILSACPSSILRAPKPKSSANGNSFLFYHKVEALMRFHRHLRTKINKLQSVFIFRKYRITFIHIHRRWHLQCIRMHKLVIRSIQCQF